MKAKGLFCVLSVLLAVILMMTACTGGEQETAPRPLRARTMFPKRPATVWAA